MRNKIPLIPLLLVLVSCHGFRPAPTTAAADTIASDSLYNPDPASYMEARGGAIYLPDLSRSSIRIYVYRDGLAARAGHNHIFGAPRFDGWMYVPEGSPRAAHFEFRVRPNDLTVDESSWRQETGDAFSGERSDSDISGTLRNMLGSRVLDAEKHPFIEVRSTGFSGEWPVLIGSFDIRIKGVVHRQDVVINVRQPDGELIAEGGFPLRQSDFGITPFSILGGLMAVQDEIAVRFRIVARRAD